MLVAFVDLTGNEAGSHIRGTIVPLVAQHPSAANQNGLVILHGLRLEFDFPDLLVEVVQLLSDSRCDKVRI